MVFGIAFNACKFEAYNEPLDVVSNLLKSMQGLGLNPLFRYLPFLEVRTCAKLVVRMRCILVLVLWLHAPNTHTWQPVKSGSALQRSIGSAGMGFKSF